jgi:hypothetical protein
MPHGKAAVRGARSSKFASLDRREQVLACVKLAKRCGLDFLVLDQTRPDVEVPVVRVIVPGLRHFYRRFAPGRLYDVPVKLGLRKRPCGKPSSIHSIRQFHRMRKRLLHPRMRCPCMRSLRFSCLGFARLARLAGDPRPIAAGNAVRRIDHHPVLSLYPPGCGASRRQARRSDRCTSGTALCPDRSVHTRKEPGGR